MTAPLTGMPLTAQGRRLSLRPPQAAELPLLAAWLPGAQVGAHGYAPLQVLALAEPSGRALGFLGYALGGPAPPLKEGPWLTIPFLVIDPQERGQGLGTEAILLLEGEARSRGLARRFAAPVPLAEGLALYFWLRLGYRPLGAARGHLWMVREESDEGSL